MGGYVGSTDACGSRVGASWTALVGRRDGCAEGFGLSGGRVGASSTAAFAVGATDGFVVGATDGFVVGRKFGTRLRRGRWKSRAKVKKGTKIKSDELGLTWASGSAGTWARASDSRWAYNKTMIQVRWAERVHGKGGRRDMLATKTYGYVGVTVGLGVPGVVG